jgi:hypothetical protein
MESVQWGTFELDTPYQNALNFIGARLAQDPAWGGYEVLDNGAGSYHVIGVQWQLGIAVTIVCVPIAQHTTWVSVIAAGSNAAEQERNNIRSLIQALGLN